MEYRIWTPWLRPPNPLPHDATYGVFSQYGNLINKSPIWEPDSLDWQDLSAADIVSRVTSKVSPGSIVLFHNAAFNTPEALPSIIETLLQEGYTFVPISEILIQGEYEIDHEGRQISA